MFTGFDALGMAALGETLDERFYWGAEASWLLDWQVFIYAATHEYITRPLDDPPEQAFFGTLEKAFRIDRSIIGDHIGEEVTVGLGEVRITNYEADYDFLARLHTPLGQPITIRMGDRTGPYAAWRTILNGFMTSHTPDRDGVTFQLRDAGHKLDVPASPNLYLGTGSTEGTSDLEGKRKPRWFGYVLNVSPPLVIPASLSYQLNDGQIQAVTAVYIRGVAQVFVGDYATVAAMNAAGLSVGQYATCLALGWMRIGVATDTELGQVTCDFEGDKLGGVFVYTAADIVRRILNIATLVVDPDELSVASFTALNALQPAALGYGIPVGDEQTAAAAIGAVMRGIGGWCGARRTGAFEVKRFATPTGAPSGRYTRDNLQSVAVGLLPEDVSPPPWRALVAYQRNYTVQTDLAGSVSEERRAFVKEELRYGVAEDESVLLDFPPGHEMVEDGGYFRDKADAEAEALRTLELYEPGRALYIVKLTEMMAIHELGQVISVTFPRLSLDAGRLMRICRIVEDDVDGIEITAFG